ncbi:MAG: LamG domain-containing protein [Polyangiaceae bacterium]|nr:LamG domain-containing protein [Polyangiaceae bacterium]
MHTIIPRFGSTALSLANSAYVDCDNPTSLNGLASYTLEAWVIPSNLAGFQAVVGKVNLNVAAEYQLYLSDGYAVAYINTPPYVIMAPDPIDTDKWHHLACTYDANAQQLVLYVDGVPVKSGTFAPVSAPTAAPVYIGASCAMNTPNWFFQGQIGRVQIWNRARSKEEILNDSVQVTPVAPVADPHLAAYLDFSMLPPRDHSGNLVPLTFKNDAGLTLSVPGVQLANQGYVDCGDGADLNFPNGAPFTLEGWFRPAGGAGTLVSKWQAAGPQYRVVYTSNGRLQASRGADTIETAPGLLQDGDYHHFGFSFDDKTRTLALYVDGNLQATKYASTSNPAANTAHLLIGAGTTSGTAGDYFNGEVQNLRVWNVALAQDDLRQWMYNDPVTDPHLVAAFDFSVTPPVDNTDQHTVTLMGPASIGVASFPLDISSRLVTIGPPNSFNANYFSQQVETFDAPPPPVDVAQGQPRIEPFTPEFQEKIWKDFITAHPPKDAETEAALRSAFESEYRRAEEMMQADPRLGRVITRVEEGGMVRLIHHGVHGDVVIYEGAAGAVSDCTLWWISFIWQLTIGFLQALGLLPPMGNISSRVYNLLIKNSAVVAAMGSVVGKAISSTVALGVMWVVWKQGLMWPLIKLALTSAGWWTLAWVLKKAIACVTGLEAAELLAGFIVWAAQLTRLSLQYPGSCGAKAA